MKTSINSKLINKGVIKNDEFKQPSRVWVNLERKVQVDNYEPVSVQVGLSVDVEEGETINDAYKRCFSEVKKALIPEIKKLLQIKNKRS